MIFTVAFWKATGERAISTGAQFAIGALGGGLLPDVSLPWWTVPLAFVGGTVLTVLKCLAATKTGNNGPSLTSAEQLRLTDGADPDLMAIQSWDAHERNPS